MHNCAVCLLILFLFRLYRQFCFITLNWYISVSLSKKKIQEFVDPARPNKAQYIAAVPPADVEMTDAEKARRYFMTLQAMMQTDQC